jgi:hypothetical protein
MTTHKRQHKAIGLAFRSPIARRQGAWSSNRPNDMAASPDVEKQEGILKHEAHEAHEGERTNSRSYTDPH